MLRLKKEEIIHSLKTNTLNIKLFYDYFLKQTGMALPREVFHSLFVHYIKQSGGLEAFLKPQMNREKVNVLIDKEGRLIKYL